MEKDEMKINCIGSSQNYFAYMNIGDVNKMGEIMLYMLRDGQAYIRNIFHLPRQCFWILDIVDNETFFVS